MSIIGKIILLETKSKSDRTTALQVSFKNEAEALSYGYANEQSPELLLRRGRATLFATGEDAEVALTHSLQESAKNGHTWPEKFRFKIVTVESEVVLAEAYRCGHEAGSVAEREACAKVCEDASGTGQIISCKSAADAIRARRTT